MLVGGKTTDLCTLSSRKTLVRRNRRQLSRLFQSFTARLATGCASWFLDLVQKRQHQVRPQRLLRLTLAVLAHDPE